MGREYSKRAVGFSGGLAVPTNAVTLSTALQTLKNEGINFVTYGTSGTPSDAQIPGAPYAGAMLTVVLDNNTTSIEENFNLASTGDLFWGSTFNTIAVASTVNDTMSFQLTAQSTSQWAVTAISSTIDWTLSATTGSTGQS